MIQGGGAGVKKRSPSRVRDNQRRSRERHKAFVEHLKRQVQEYERQGVQATLDMQQAARHVALENSKLRLMLRNRGVSDEEIERFLETGVDDDQTMDDSAKSAESQGTKHQPRQSGCEENVRQPHSPRALQSMKRAKHTPSPQRSATVAADSSLSAMDDIRAQRECCNGETKCTFPTEQPALANPAPRLEGTPGQLDSSTTMPCSAAAEILSGMHGNRDRGLVMASLGCRADEECAVKNTRLFELLEKCDDRI